MGLLNAENCARFNLCEAATLNDAAALRSEMGFELLAFGNSETNIGNDFAAAFFEGRASSVFGRRR